MHTAFHLLASSAHKKAPVADQASRRPLDFLLVVQHLRFMLARPQRDMQEHTRLTIPRLKPRDSWAEHCEPRRTKPAVTVRTRSLGTRQRVGKDSHSRATIMNMDAQSVKTVEESAHISGHDGHKHVKGRKRYVVVDALGLPISIFVTPADMHVTGTTRRARVASWSHGNTSSPAQEDLG